MIGIGRVAGAAFRRRVASQPSSTGRRLRSIRIRSGAVASGSWGGQRPSLVLKFATLPVVEVRFAVLAIEPRIQAAERIVADHGLSVGVNDVPRRAIL
jgi:hypothetical protein